MASAFEFEQPRGNAAIVSLEYINCASMDTAEAQDHVASSNSTSQHLCMLKYASRRYTLLRTLHGAESQRA